MKLYINVLALLTAFVVAVVRLRSNMPLETCQVRSIQVIAVELHKVYTNMMYMHHQACCRKYQNVCEYFDAKFTQVDTQQYYLRSNQETWQVCTWGNVLQVHCDIAYWIVYLPDNKSKKTIQDMSPCLNSIQTNHNAMAAWLTYYQCDPYHGACSAHWRYRPSCTWYLHRHYTLQSVVSDPSVRASVAFW